ncbi:hypothetical protein [Listeria fleischmannii]|uniref:Uncharacterized protein n=1 Tax=Listeria fleischmannii FSL S10-1203 TaxID=1265822 RepID=W7DL15_9LIST|nr:hypothetical protein [Listeria fleischmannii]EUJ52984.1 hypothetical protein MCOL2_11992 [Listeria fleischmannii FSL S10-1203]
MKRLFLAVVAIALAIFVTPVQVNAADNLGWSEDGDQAVQQAPRMMLKASNKPDSHKGWRETRHPGGANRPPQWRSIGETKWKGMYHYTRARMEVRGWFSGKITVMSDSGRIWRTGSSKAVSPWVNQGKAYTYWGNER